MSTSESHTSNTAGQKTVTKGISGIGLAAEVIHNREQRKGKAAERNESQQNKSPSHNVKESDREVSRSIQCHDNDDHPSSHMQQQAQDQVHFDKSPPPSCEKAANETEGSAANEGEIFQLANSFLRAFLSLSSSLNDDLVDGGFIRAYSPLNDVGIDQTTFLDFIDNFNKAVRPNSLIQALNLPSIAGLAAPDHIGILIGIAVQVVTNIADEVDSRGKTISFLDKTKDSFFAPRGLIALIISWKPSERNELVTTSNFDMTSAISSAVAKSESRGIKKANHKFKTSNGISKFEWLETDPLIFPKLDDLVEFEADGCPAQSILANVAPKETFNSKYSDFNHPVSSGDPLALMTGGRAQLPFITLPFLARKNSEPTPRDDSSNPSLAGPGTLGKSKNVALPFLSGDLTLLQNDILYLMIVNRPTEQQLAEASDILRTMHQ
ncbi:hypothetical protein BCON_0031g00050 [Botryotinia convoluta]|uniref:Uncharacterized protein n=1 Tax=Botryotinia convoluta TaxID=54673 RepID=A0A4Z1IHJ0_9HELO|nr:hypothetical protein BCON_0031g00050 [Botryotinia convoluta]